MIGVLEAMNRRAPALQRVSLLRKERCRFKAETKQRQQVLCLK